MCLYSSHSGYVCLTNAAVNSADSLIEANTISFPI